MAAQLFSIHSRAAAAGDWSAQELAEFYRVEAALIQVGLRLVTARGITDENDPWFAFCNPEDDEVIIHFARFDRRYLISSPAYCGTAMGYDFRKLVRSTIELHPVFQPRPKNLFLHPTALLVALVASAYFYSGRIGEAAPAKPAAADVNKYLGRVLPVELAGVGTEARHEMVVLAAIGAVNSALAEANPIAIVVTASTHAVDAVGPLPVLSRDLDLPSEIGAHGGGSVVGHSVIAEQQGPMPVLLTHLASPSNGMAVALHASSLFTAGQATLTPLIASTAVAPPIPIPPEVHLPSSDLVPGAQFVPLNSVPGIPKAELDLLHAVGAPAVVQYSPTLPVPLSLLVQAGVHSGPIHTTDPYAPSYATTSAAAANPTHDPMTASPADATRGPDTSTPPLTTTPPPTTTATSMIQTATKTLDMAAVIDAIDQFRSIAHQPVFLMTEHSAIIYDEAPVGSNFGAVKSITYDFNDGFSVSLVGLPSQLAHVSLHV